MKIERMDIPAAGIWARDCELIFLSSYKGLTLYYHKDDDDTYWSLRCEVVPAYKVCGEEFSATGYLIKLPVEGSFFEVLDSPWMIDFKKYHDKILDNCKHCIFQFYDETVEIIAQNFVFEQLKGKPVINIELSQT